MDANELVAWNVRRLRVARGVSQETLAVDAGIDRTYVSRLERTFGARAGQKTENPTVAVLERLASALSVEIVELFAVPAPGAAAPAVLPKGRRKR